MPRQNGFSIKQNTPEADRLEHRVHDQLKQIWDPAADATVAKYLTAMVAKGYDRRKIFSQLKPILDDSITVQLLDWLYKHLRLHGNEYQSTEVPASSKPASKPPPSSQQIVLTEEVELRLEDLEAQQLEGSDLEDDAEDVDTRGVSANAGAEGPGPSNHIGQAQQCQQENRGSGGAHSEGPTRQAVQVTNAPHAPEQNGAQAIGKVERRHREPIPVPNFSEHSWAKASRGVGDANPYSEQAPAAHNEATAGAAPQPAAVPEHLPPPREEKLSQQQQALATAADRRRLKSSVVLDWESWHKQRQPAEEQRAAKPSAQQGKSAGPERAPILPRAQQEGQEPAAQQLTSHQEREGGPDRERDRSSGPSRRKEPHDAEPERSGSRYRDGDGDAEGQRRGYELEAAGRPRRRGADLVHRSRSRSRSPRGRRQGRAPLVTANLLRNALREVDGLASGSGARGSKLSVFERLGVSGGAVDVAAPRTSALQRLGGSEKAEVMDTTGSGRKRGPEDDVDADKEALGSPTKVARGTVAHRPSTAPRSNSAPDGVQPTKTGAGAISKQRLEHAPMQAPAGPGTARQSSQKRDLEVRVVAGGPNSSEGGPAGKTPSVRTAADAEVAGDLKASELEALRQQLLAMQEKIARIEEAAKDQPPQLQSQSQPLPQPQVQVVQQGQSQLERQLQSQPQLQPQLQPAASSRPQPQLQVRPQPLPISQSQSALMQPQPATAVNVVQPHQHVPIAARLQPPRLPAPPAAAMGVRPTGGMAASSGAGAGSATSILPTSMTDVVIEGGSGSPPRRPASQLPEPAPKADPQRIAAAKLDADLRSVVVENVHFLANPEVLAAHFSVAGPVKNVTIVHDKISGRPTGMAVVEMATEQGTQAAAGLSGSLLMDLPIIVTLKAVLMLQGINLPAPRPPVGAGPAHVPGGRLNPAAAPFVPALAALTPAGVGPGRGSAGVVRPPSGAAGGWQPWPKLGAGGRGRGSNVWVRDGARPTNAISSNVTERS
ncbi:hypothetical protein Vafri_4296 [Volvox africanus]|uniref:RRM domain-containing protein n=1 Tax=Volvox africanus TaxID=51714 RepID=A0A8J4EUI5_9CHLO|nr:hypothetical protein Vafri_4296 [Volvox africanus]